MNNHNFEFSEDSRKYSICIDGDGEWPVKIRLNERLSDLKRLYILNKLFNYEHCISHIEHLKTVSRKEKSKIFKRLKYEQY
jgi:hypothetical protein